MTTGRLLLTPNDPMASFDRDQAVALLHELEIIGEPLPRLAPDAFAADSELMRWISFAGCSPFLRFEPEGEGDEDFCHVRLSPPAGDRPFFYSGDNTKPPTCPRCRQVVKEWRRLIEERRLGDRIWQCPGCGGATSASALNWRRHGGFACRFVAIHSVFPGEAAPVSALLDRLGRALSDGAAWRYFYLRP